MSRAPHQRGFSIVELMVAMTLSLILLAGVLAVLYSSKVTYAENERVARLQENARASVDLMLRDMRSGGFRGCARPVRPQDFENLMPTPTALLWNFGEPIRGFEGSSGVFVPALDVALIPAALPNSDVIVVRAVTPGMSSLRVNADMPNGAANVTVNKAVGLVWPNNSPILVSNCDRSSVFPMVAMIDGGATATLTHGAVNIGVFREGAIASPLATVIYYVRNGAAGQPSLWRRVGTAAPQEVVEGVERIEARYGEDTNGDLLADNYVAADAVVTWDNVVAVELAVLIRSTEQLGPNELSRPFQMLDVAVPAFNDRFQRTMFTTTATLRNRAL